MDGIVASERSYAIRITCAFSLFISNFFQEVLRQTKAEAFAVVEHAEEGKRTHIHAALLNAEVSHKRIKQIIQAVFSGLPKFELKEVSDDIKGAGNFSMKKWDEADKYLVYMIKGKYPLVFNKKRDDTEWISPERYEMLKSLWVSKNPQQSEYTNFANSRFYPRSVVVSLTEEQMLRSTTQHVLTKTEPPPFDTVKENATEYVLELYGGYMNAKNRFVVKDLISNFCIRNKIKILPYYI
jgi:hypothetical protein